VIVLETNEDGLIKNKIKLMLSINIFFLTDLMNLNKSFDSNLDQPIAKRLPGVGSGHSSHSLPLQPAFGLAMVDIIF
jgi:hypothetical protein